MAVKPVKFISDILVKRQILKTDVNENVLFSVSGTLPDGSVSSSLPITASGLSIDGYGYIKELDISGSNLTNIGSTGPLHNVYDVFALIDSKLAALASTTINETLTGSFDADGSKNIQLTKFTAADVEYVYVDVMVKIAGSSVYKNDLISVELSGNIAANKLHIILGAAALSTGDSYRIIANKTSESP